MNTNLVNGDPQPRPIPPDQHPAAVYLARLGPGSRPTMKRALDTVARALTADRCTAETLDWARVRHQHAMAMRAALAETHAPATVNKAIAALRGVLQEAWRLGYIGTDAYLRTVDIPLLRGNAPPRGRALSMGELRAVFAACCQDRTPAGPRDAAVIAVLYGTGMGPSQLAALELSDYLPEVEEIRVRHRRRSKARVCYLPAGCATALGKWLPVRGPEPGPLFCPINRAHRMHLKAVSSSAVRFILQLRAREAGVSLFTPQDLQRTFVHHLLDAGADISAIQKMLGHASVQTTLRYDQRAGTARLRLVNPLDVPFVETH